MTNTVKFGVVSWGEDSNLNFNNKKNENRKSFGFFKPKDGNNIIRVITDPRRYYAVSIPSKPFAKRVKITYPNDGCPAMEAGFRPQERHYIGIIDRSDANDPVKLYDMGPAIWRQLSDLKSDPEFENFDPKGFDFNLKKNSKSQDPGGFYNVIPRSPNPLSSEDLEIKEKNMEELEAALNRLCQPYDPEKTDEEMRKNGWDGKPVPKKEFKQEEELQDNDDDLNFTL